MVYSDNKSSTTCWQMTENQSHVLQVNGWFFLGIKFVFLILPVIGSKHIDTFTRKKTKRLHRCNAITDTYRKCSLHDYKSYVVVSIENSGNWIVSRLKENCDNMRDLSMELFTSCLRKVTWQFYIWLNNILNHPIMDYFHHKPDLRFLYSS